MGGTASRLSLVVEAPTAQATFTERGTRPHGINPRKKGALFIPSRGGGFLISRNAGLQRWMVTRTGKGKMRTWLMPAGRIFAVWHPGTKATHWFSNTIKAEAPWLPIDIKAAIRGALGMA